MADPAATAGSSPDPGGWPQAPDFGQPQNPPSYGGSQPTQSPPYDAGQQGYQQPPAYGQQGYDPAQPPPYAPQGYPPQPGYPPQQAYPPAQYGQAGYPQPAGQLPVSLSDETTWGIVSHISIPFFGFIGPLIAYLMYKDRSPWLKEASTEALNFSILYSIASVVSSILISVFVGAILWPIVFIVALVFCILATMAASRHELYRYPVNVRFIK